MMKLTIFISADKKETFPKDNNFFLKNYPKFKQRNFD